MLCGLSYTYGHRQQKTGHPVRSAIHKLLIGRLVVGSVTTSESLLLYVFLIFLIFLGGVVVSSERLRGSERV